MSTDQYTFIVIMLGAATGALIGIMIQVASIAISLSQIARDLKERVTQEARRK